MECIIIKYYCTIIDSEATKPCRVKFVSGLFKCWLNAMVLFILNVLMKLRIEILLILIFSVETLQAKSINPCAIINGNFMEYLLQEIYLTNNLFSKFVSM